MAKIIKITGSKSSASSKGTNTTPNGTQVHYTVPVNKVAKVRLESSSSESSSSSGSSSSSSSSIGAQVVSSSSSSSSNGSSSSSTNRRNALAGQGNATTVVTNNSYDSAVLIAKGAGTQPGLGGTIGIAVDRYHYLVAGETISSSGSSSSSSSSNGSSGSSITVTIFEEDAE